jgi:hypothetical protein
MPKYKAGQFIKVPHEKGLYRVKKGVCKDCALNNRKCIDSCVFTIGWSNMIVKVE